MAEQKAPKYRFPGFTEEWEQRKVGELIKAHNAGIYISNDKYGEGTNVIGVGNIYDSDIFDGEVYRLGHVDDNKFLLDEGDLVYGESSLVLEGIARTICVGKNGAGSAFAWHTRRVKLDKTRVNPHFATLELNYHPVVRKHLMSVATKTALTGMTTDGYFSAPLFLPCIEEQRRISALFIDLDNLISLHQRKLDNIKEYKSGLLQKMFPKPGETEPELRFPGFIGHWEQRKLGDCSTLITKGTTPSSFSEKGSVSFVKIEALRDKRVIKALCSSIEEDIHTGELARSVLKENDIVFAIAGATVGKCAVISKEILPANTNQALAIVRLKEEINRDFIYLSLTSEQMKTYIRLSKSVGAQPNLSLAQMNDFVFVCPKDSDEQAKIGEFFSDIDNLITLHQRRLDELKEYKQSLLQQMFI